VHEGGQVVLSSYLDGESPCGRLSLVQNERYARVAQPVDTQVARRNCVALVCRADVVDAAVHLFEHTLGHAKVRHDRLR